MLLGFNQALRCHYVILYINKLDKVKAIPMSRCQLQLQNTNTTITISINLCSQWLMEMCCHINTWFCILAISANWAMFVINFDTDTFTNLRLCGWIWKNEYAIRNWVLGDAQVSPFLSYGLGSHTPSTIVFSSVLYSHTPTKSTMDNLTSCNTLSNIDRTIETVTSLARQQLPLGIRKLWHNVWHV